MPYTCFEKQQAIHEQNNIIQKSDLKVVFVGLKKRRWIPQIPPHFLFLLGCFIILVVFTLIRGV